MGQTRKVTNLGEVVLSMREKETQLYLEAGVWHSG